MIDIIGDVIYFDNQAVGVVIVPSGSLRWNFEEAMRFDVTSEEITLREQLDQMEVMRDEKTAESLKARQTINKALRYAEDKSEPDWQKLIEILS